MMITRRSGSLTASARASLMSATVGVMRYPGMMRCASAAGVTGRRRARAACRARAATSVRTGSDTR